MDGPARPDPSAKAAASGGTSRPEIGL